MTRIDWEALNIDPTLSTGDNRPPVYYDTIDGKTVLVIRASAVGGSCLWELVAAGQGLEPGPLPDVLVRAFAEGNALEPMVVEMMEREHDFIFTSHQEEGELWLSDDVVIRYHSDGLGFSAVYPKCVVEIKALSDALWQTFRSKGMENVLGEYPWQLSSMMHESGLPGLWVGFNKGMSPDANGNREPCKDEGKLHFQIVRTPPISLEELQLKASLIKIGVEDEDITTSDRTCGDADAWPCRYLHIRPEPEPGNATTDPETFYVAGDVEEDKVNNLIKEYVFWKGNAAEAEQRRDAAKEALIKLTSDNHKRIVTTRWRVPVVRGTVKQFDKSLMSDEDRAVYEAIVKKYTVKKPKAPYLTKIKRLDA